MEETNGELTVTVRAKNIPELRTKLLKILGEMEDSNHTSEDFPENIKKIYPEYESNPHSAAILTVLREKHVGKANAIFSWELSEEMIDQFPRLFKGKTQGQVSRGNILPANHLEKAGLLKIGHQKYQNTADEYRVYWVE